MILGHTVYVACPHCGRVWGYQTLMSGNTLGARYWTDGKRDAPMLPQNPPLVRCTTCSKFFWPEREKEIATKNPIVVSTEHEDVELIVEPEEDDYYEALEEGLFADAEEELWLRTLAWQKSNDDYRDERDAPEPISRHENWRRNLEQVLVLAGSAEQSILRAEVLRELGRFQEALLEFPLANDRDDNPFAVKIRALSKAADPGVSEVHLD